MQKIADMKLLTRIREYDLSQVVYGGDCHVGLRRMANTTNVQSALLAMTAELMDFVTRGLKITN